MSKSSPNLSVDPEKDQPAPKPGPPPDGGFQAWLQPVVGHLAFFNTWGVTNSFGVFQQYYAETLGHPPSDISWIGGVQVFLLFFVGVYTGRLTDGGHAKVVYGTGVALQLIGTFLTSICHKYWQIFLAQAVCVGIGNGFTFTPAISVLSSYFLKNRALAVGIASAGGATGGIVFPAVANRLLYHSNVGFPWTMRIIGFIMLGAHIPPLLFLKPRLPPRKSGPWVEWGAFKEMPYLFFVFSWFFNFWGLYFAFFYLGTFARNRLGISDSINLVMVLNGIGFIGRIMPNLIGDRKTGMFNILIPISFTASLLIFCWTAVHSEAGIYVFAVVYGVAAAALQSLFPATATLLTTDLSKLGTRLGMMMSIVAFATLTGPAIDGALIQLDNGGYLYAQMFAASSILLGALAAVAARIFKAGWNLKVKV